MPSIPIYGLYYFYQQQVVSLPLLGVRAEASIKELAAQVKLTQTYGNDATFPIEAKYSFPIPARASVCSFVMIKQDGSRIVGSVQEKQEARETYNAAVSQGQQASLMEQQSPDVFQVAVGNIPSNEQVQIELVYATELSEDEESDSIRFHLPVHIGARYGRAPESILSSFKRNIFTSLSSPTPFLSLAMSVEAIAPISKIGCPSHTVSTELGPDPKLPNSKELPFSNYARVSLTSDSPLDKDFVLTIKSAGLDAPRCVAELHPTHETVAMALTLVPRFKLPDLSRQEFVFMVDRSGSMGGKRIEAAKKALVVMLRALPHQESLFQIVSFGSRASSLWPQGSQPYNQETLEKATRHVDAMKADYGGTEIRAALQHCFKARKLDRPMSLLVLTDGDAWDLDGVFAEVKSAVAAAPKNAFLRVSVLGIGNSASTAMCEGMARLGNGTCMLVGEQEGTFTGKIARMLKAAKSPPISDIIVEWGLPAATGSAPDNASGPPDYDDFEIVEQQGEKNDEKKTLNIFDKSIEDPIAASTTPPPPPPPSEVVLPPPPPVQQAPFRIENLFPNIRLNVYAILQGKNIPETVIIRGRTFDGAEIALPVPVILSRLQNLPGVPPAVHALAARKIIQDLDDGKHELAQTLANPDDKDLLARTVKASIIRLGKTYSIASSHTSFVAVDESKPTSSPHVVPDAFFLVHDPRPPQADLFMARGRATPQAARGMPSGAPIQMARGARRSSSGFGGLGAMGSAIKSAVGNVLGSPASSSQTTLSPSTSASPPVPQKVVHYAGNLSDFRTMKKQQGGFMGSSHRQSSSSPSPSLDSEFDAPPRPTDVARGKAAPQSGRAMPRGASAASSDPLEALARLQSFDGCFSLSVLDVIKLKTDIQAVRAVFPAGSTDTIVATVLAIAFLSTKLGAGVDRDSWEAIHEKAHQYVEAALRSMGATQTADALEAMAVQLLA